VLFKKLSTFTSISYTLLETYITQVTLSLYQHWDWCGPTLWGSNGFLALSIAYLNVI